MDEKKHDYRELLKEVGKIICPLFRRDLIVVTY